VSRCVALVISAALPRGVRSLNRKQKMKTSQELILDFMLAIASNIKQEDIDFIEDEPETADHFADCALSMAQTLTRKYLESL
jgi:hypothetical protein